MCPTTNHATRRLAGRSPGLYKSTSSIFTPPPGGTNVAGRSLTKVRPAVRNSLKFADFDATARSLHKTRECKPRNIFAHRNLEMTLAEIGMLEEAKVPITKVIESDHDHNGIYDYSGDLLCCLGKFEGAVVHWQKAARLEPQSFPIHIRRAGTCRRLAALSSPSATCPRRFALVVPLRTATNNGEDHGQRSIWNRQSIRMGQGRPWLLLHPGVSGRRGRGSVACCRL